MIVESSSLTGSTNSIMLFLIININSLIIWLEVFVFFPLLLFLKFFS